ncbi:Hypothetical protein PFR_JS9-2_292 [Propionibacterium freudenreichii]|nr:Hypothetical protein PFR_JS9-1_294 [Propionibacterium freudenreichii]SCQ66496.1 Hypothetical protein PFR_JS9-2_292 [Propionibacterium freudenreichii]SCQ76613.1 Hypothetical protein PFR_JS20-1_2098 [Propionibacterium freudenreichii]SCQ83332.1 Hypothetical protein PFR_JS20-2_2106 [Propionibacterium freudenreichii]
MLLPTRREAPSGSELGASLNRCTTVLAGTGDEPVPANTVW